MSDKKFTSMLSSKEVSQVRKKMILSDGEIERGDFVSGIKKGILNQEGSIHSYANIIPGFLKSASNMSTSSTIGSSWRGGGGTVRQAPEMYSPLWLTSNTQLPRDRGTMNAWARAFFALNPIVNNGLSLHSTYPISKLNIKCENKKIESFFEEMNYEMELHNACVQIAQEFFVIGECFPYLQLDERKLKWSKIIIQNPDYVYVKRSVVAGEPQISLKPDSELTRIITSNDAESIKLRRSIPGNIVNFVKAGKNIPLDNFYVSHIARKISPYDTHGTSLIAPTFKALMLWDKLRECKYAQADNLINPITLVKLGGSADSEYKIHPSDLEHWRQLLEQCHDEETEVLTDQGFKKFNEVIDFDPTVKDICVPANTKEGFKIACFNPNNEELEYHVPERAVVYNHDGDMYHFHTNKLDIKVTPNHKMWVSKTKKKTINNKRKVIWKDWEKIEAKDLNLNSYNKFRTKISWKGNDNIKTVNVIDKEVPIELYLEFLGYLISDGHVSKSKNYHYNVGISQTINKHYVKMKNCIDQMADILGVSYQEFIQNGEKENYSNCWTARFDNKKIFEHFKAEIQNENGETKCYHKRIPRWVLQLNPKLLKILLQALVDGDGSVYNNKNKSKRFMYFTTSKALLDDVYELVYKCGYSPLSFTTNRKGKTAFIRGSEYEMKDVYVVSWSDTKNGDFPLIYKTSTSIKNNKKEKKQNLSIEHYKGKVWCFTVPTGLFITRRNGKVTIQSNSQYDKDFKIITHGSVSIERIGAQAVIDINPDLQQLMKEIYIGLMIPQVLMESGDITYANGGLSLDTLRQRYMQFQNMMAKWIRTKIFQPISILNDFWEYIDGEKKLIVPEVEWNHMAMFDLADYIQMISQLVTAEKKVVSIQTLFRSLGADYKDERQKIRQEAIDDAIHAREQEVLGKLSLTELRALDPTAEIPDKPDTPVPGESTGEEPVAGQEGGDGAGGGMGMGGGGMDMPPPPPPPPPPPE